MSLCETESLSVPLLYAQSRVTACVDGCSSLTFHPVHEFKSLLTPEGARRSNLQDGVAVTHDAIVV